jgi:hypothetical protein
VEILQGFIREALKFENAICEFKVNTDQEYFINKKIMITKLYATILSNIIHDLRIMLLKNLNK